MATNVPITIDPEEELPPALDYSLLKAEGLELVQQLSGDIWTEYNESDPGVTNLEQLCYALTELSYRARISLADLLVDPKTGKTNPHRQALFVARRIFPCNPVTENDYRKLLVDRVATLGNVWLEPWRGDSAAASTAADTAADEEVVDGQYDIWAYVPGAQDPECFPDESTQLQREIWRVYNHHRGLCEDIHEVRVLRPVRTHVFGDLILDRNADANDVLARVLFAISQLFAPELRRQPLKALLDAGEASSAIFDGPLLLNGFIDEAQLQPKADSIGVQEVVRTITRTTGVASVTQIRVRVRDRDYTGNESIDVDESEILQLDPYSDGAFSLRLIRDGQQIEPEAARVERQLQKLQAEQRRTYRLSEQYDQYFAFPAGQKKPLRPYYSIQEQYPNVYGISSFGLPEGSPASRRGQAKQLKGYLLVFEQLLADYFAQLARVRDLFSISELSRTYFYQYLDRSVPDVEPLLSDGSDGGPSYRRGLPRLVRSQDPALERHNRFLDHLLSLYAESLDASSLFQRTCGASGASGDLQQRLITAKREFLNQLVTSTRNRGRGFDYMDRPSRRNVAGMEIKVRIQLGMNPRPLGAALDELSLELVEDEAQASIGRPLQRHSYYIDEHFDGLEVDAPTEVPTEATAGLATPWQPVTEGLIAAASSIRNFRVGSFEGDRRLALVCRAPGTDEWRLIGKFTSQEAAAASAADLVERIGAVQHHCSQLYVVEHNLLRFGRDEDSTLVYSFTLTVVISTCSELAEDEEYQQFAAEIVRQNAPAHIATGMCFLSPYRMCQFEDLYGAWRSALRTWSRSRQQQGDAWSRLVDSSAALREFLQRQCGRGDEDGGRG